MRTRTAAALLLAGMTAMPVDADDTIVLLPDTQYYSLRDPATYELQTDWIAANRDSRSIRMVIHMGDITHNNTIAEWDNALEAHATLDSADVRYTMVPGNHDNPEGGKVRDTARYNQYFGVAKFDQYAWWNHKPGNADNNYATFILEGKNFLVLNLEFAPRKDAACWANDVVRSHPQHQVIVATHCYQNRNGGDHRTDCATSYGLTGNDGDTLWRELVRRHSNIRLVLSGHVGGSEHRTRTGSGGNTVHEILTDYQFERRNEENHGNGWMRTLEFDSASSRMEVSTFTVLDDVSQLNRTEYYDADPNDSQHQYDVQFSLNRTPYQFDDTPTPFNDRTVNAVASGQQRAPSIGAAANGNHVVVWEDDSNENDIFEIKMRGLSADGCQTFSQRTVNAESAGQQIRPALAVAEDGRFVVVWQDDRDGNGLFQIYAAGYDSHGDRIFSERAVNQVADGQQYAPVVAIDAEGNFVVAWEDDQDENGLFQIRVAGFSASGARRFDDRTVNQTASGQQRRPAVAMDDAGRFFVTFEDDNNENDVFQIFAAGFNANGSRRFDDITVNREAAGQQLRPHIAAGPSGDFVVVWEDDNNENDVYEIFAAGFDRDGNRRFGDITVNQESDGEQRRPAVAMDDSGRFAVTWEDDKDGNGSYQILMAGFSGTGGRAFADRVVNRNADGQQQRPSIAFDANDRALVAWEDDLDGNSFLQILNNAQLMNW